MVILLPGCDGESLRVLADFLYTGTAVFVREDVGNDFYALLAKEIQVTRLKSALRARPRASALRADGLHLRVDF